MAIHSVATSPRSASVYVRSVYGCNSAPCRRFRATIEPGECKPLLYKASGAALCKRKKSKSKDQSICADDEHSQTTRRVPARQGPLNEAASRPYFHNRRPSMLRPHAYGVHQREKIEKVTEVRKSSTFHTSLVMYCSKLPSTTHGVWYRRASASRPVVRRVRVLLS